jgi:hypothetical protein
MMAKEKKKKKSTAEYDAVDFSFCTQHGTYPRL